MLVHETFARGHVALCLSFAHNSSNDRVGGKKKRQPTKIEEREGRKTVPGRGGVRFRVVCKTARGKKRFQPVNRT